MRHLLQRLAAALLAGLAIGAAAVAGAEDPEWDVVAYDKCIKNGGSVFGCCITTGGVPTTDDKGADKCVAPPPLDSNPAR